MKFSDKLIKSKTLYQGHTLDLKVSTLINEDNLEYEREIIYRKDAVAIVATAGDEVVLVKQYRAPIDKPLLELPAGIVEDNDPEKTAYKELIEEAGYEARSLKFLTKYYSSAGYTDEIVYIYHTDDLKEVQPQLEEEEIIEIIKMPLEDAIKKVRCGEIVDAKTIIGLLMTYETK